MTNLRKGEYFVLKNVLAFLLKIAQANLWVTKEWTAWGSKGPLGSRQWARLHFVQKSAEWRGLLGLPGVSQGKRRQSPHPQVLGFYFWADWGLRGGREVPEHGQFSLKFRIWEGQLKGLHYPLPSLWWEKTSAYRNASIVFFSLNTKGN